MTILLPMAPSRHLLESIVARAGRIEQSMGWGSLSPWADHLYPAPCEIIDVAGDDWQAAGFGDCRNQSVEPFETAAGTFTSNHQVTKGIGSCCIEIKHATRKNARRKTVESGL